MTDQPAKISISMQTVGEIVWEIYETHRTEGPEKALCKYFALAGEYLASGKKLHEIFSFYT